MVASRAVVLAVAMSLAGCLQADVPASTAEGDGLSEGDTWTLALKDEDGNELEEGALRIKITVVGRSMVDGIDAFELRTVVESEDPQDTPQSSTVWLRASDLAAIREESVSTEIRGGEEYPSTHSHWYREPCPDANAGPFEVGTTWTVTCQEKHTFTGFSDGSLPQGDAWGNDTKTYTVEARERITVDAGTFDTYRVRVASEDFEDSSDQASIHWIAPGVCAGLIKVDTHEGSIVELVDHDC